MKKVVSLLTLAVVLTGSPAFAAQPKQPKKPKLTPSQKRIWTRTDGVVTSTVPPIDLSGGQTSAAAAAKPAVSGVKTSALSDLIPNVGCPTQHIPLNGGEIVVAQGTTSAPPGTSVNWEFSPTGSVDVEFIGSDQQGIFTAYVGAAPPGCTDFASCSSGLTATTIANIYQQFGQHLVPFVLDAPNLAPTDTAVFFITVQLLPNSPSSWPFALCQNAMFLPFAHSITPQ